MQRVIEKPPLPFDGNVYCKVGKDLLTSYCFDVVPTHSIVVVLDYPEFPKRFACCLEECKSQEEASEKAKQALKEKKYGYMYVFRDETFNRFWAVCTHFQRFESESSGYMNFRQVKHAKIIEKAELIYQAKDVYTPKYEKN